MSTSSEWEEIPSNAGSDSPMSTRRANRHKSVPDFLESTTETGDESPLKSKHTAPKFSLATDASDMKSSQPEFTMIDTPRGPRDRSIQAHSVSLNQTPPESTEDVTSAGAASTVYTTSSRPPLHPTAAAGPFPHIEPAHPTVDLGGVFPSAASMDSLVGGPQSLHFSPTTPMQRDTWRQVTQQPLTPDLSTSAKFEAGSGRRASSDSAERAPANSVVRNHQASLFTAALGGFEDADEQRAELTSTPPTPDSGAARHTTEVFRCEGVERTNVSREAIGEATRQRALDQLSPQHHPVSSVTKFKWRPYLLSVYRWHRPRHSAVAVATMAVTTLAILPFILVSIGPLRFCLFGFAALQLLCATLIGLAGMPIMRGLFVRGGLVDSQSSVPPRRQVQQLIRRTAQASLRSRLQRLNLKAAVVQLGGSLWDRLVELVDPTEAVQGEHEAAVRLIESDRKRRSSIDARHVDPFAGLEQAKASEEEDSAAEALLQQSAYFDSAAVAGAADGSSPQSKAATIDVLVQEALRTERYALGKKLFLLLAVLMVIVQPYLEWAVQGSSSPISFLLFLVGVFVAGRYPIRRYLRREYIRYYGVTAGPFAASPRLGQSNGSKGSPAFSPLASSLEGHPPGLDKCGSDTASAASRSEVTPPSETTEEDDVTGPGNMSFMDTVTASVRSFVIGPMEDEVDNSEVFSGRPSEDFGRSPSPLRGEDEGAAAKAKPTPQAPDDILKSTMREINRRRTMSMIQQQQNEEAAAASGVAQLASTSSTVEEDVPVPLTIKWVVGDACLLIVMSAALSLWKVAFNAL